MLTCCTTVHSHQVRIGFTQSVRCESLQTTQSQHISSLQAFDVGGFITPPVQLSLSLYYMLIKHQDVLPSCLALKGQLWIDDQRQSLCQHYKRDDNSGKRSSQEINCASLKDTEPRLLLHLYKDQVKRREKKKWRKVLNAGRRGNTWQQPHYTHPNHSPPKHSQQQKSGLWHRQCGQWANQQLALLRSLASWAAGYFWVAGAMLSFDLIEAQIPPFTPLPEVRAVTGLVC